MKQKKIISIIAIVVIIGIISSVAYFYKPNIPNENKSQWVVSGPFAISKPQYKLGENIFLTVNGLKPNEAGNIVILHPDNKSHMIIPFNGTLKDHFNQYFKPDTSKPLGILHPRELVGNWTVLFQGVPYEPIRFEILNEFLPGAETDIVPIEPTNSTK